MQQPLLVVEYLAMLKLVRFDFEFGCKKVCGVKRSCSVSGSIPSLGAGLAFGAILGYGAHLNSQTPPKPLFQLGNKMNHPQYEFGVFE